ncbi:AAA family ATPase [Mycoplasma todarodis]|uniref:Chromosome partition protein Smc n=1 Tax=Mycoplasma todarodis TaxID=1937191 RepID=A0A4R0XJK5_9MOLU|nr:AAA family ATPase [Mycoplasma todarodis]TCG10614.1 ABC transporter ATP-binding protein [Mycoplasma todarodis]
MRLIKVIAHGFKSFADKTELNFDGGVVGIVGPNGSGKSNINDAIKWVLGEQSSKSLRGDSMEDVIFAGSKTVPAMNFAEVTLTFDNSEGRVSLPHKKISITRKLTRGKGGNQYFINGDIARLRDIKEIAMETGMSKSSLAIISQGTISDIAQATPEERRGIFEEAAGISKYKSRKKEAIKKLDNTTEALEKVQTVVYELERQLKPLKKQAEKAKLYLEKTEELKDVEVGLIVEDVAYFREQLEELNEKLSDVIDTKDDLETRISNSEKDIEQKTSYKLNLENEVLKLNTRFQEVSESIRDLELKDSITSQRRQMIIDGQVQTSEAAKTEAMKEQLEELSTKLSQYKAWISRAEEDVRSKKADAAEKEMRITKLQSKKELDATKLFKIKTKIDILEDHKNNKTNLFQGTKTIVQNKSTFPGVKGIVADSLEVPEEYTTAVETILQNALQHIVVDNSKTAVECVNFLKRNRGGRATFIPLASIQPKAIREDHKLALDTQPGFIGIAAELVNSKPQYNILKKFLLGNIIVVDSIENATQISKLLQQRYMVVTKGGDIIRVGGVIAGGQAGKTRDLLGVDKQIEKLKSAQPLIQKEVEQITSEISTLSNIISEDRAIIGELYVEVAKTKEKESNVKEQYLYLKDKYEVAANKKFDISKTQEISLGSVENFEAEKSQLSATLKAKREKIMAINNELTQNTLMKTELEKSLRQIIKDSSENMTKKNQAEFYVNTAMKRLAEEYAMTIEAAAEEFTLKLEREEARDFVSRMRKEIAEIGHVNLDSIKSYEEVNERYTKLKTSEEELFSAQQTILSAINEMDKIIITKLDTTVKATREEFQKVFETMFGGGTAEIKYTDPENLLETGIDVIAQPPGKSVRNLKLFSGGEKAIIAISLLFAILKSKPLPLCILDEVEAALDEANVLRYAQFLQSLKGSTQFIVVTHRVGTMENVDHLFGATMQNRGVTSFFSVKLDTAKELIES